MENVPVVIGRYRLSKTLGIGAFGKVKLGEHMLTGHKVAVKILNRGKIQALDMEEKVKREINILKLCRHPHIVRLHEIIDTPSDIFMVMEYAPNGELFDYIVSKGRPTTEEAQRLFQQIVTAVEYCHFHHIVHRDLKPENLLLDQDNNLKIADFGLSNMMRDGEFLRTSCGSPNYAAPEVIMGTLYAGPEVDVWSCGVILYALLCGSLPFDDESIPSLFKKIKSGMYSLPSHLSPLTRDLVPRMLVVDPMKRITIAEIKMHPWFLQAIPLYLTLTPAQLEDQAGKVDEEVVDMLCKLPVKGITRERIHLALAHKGYKKKGEFEHELRVVYELIQGNKLHKERLKQCVSANKIHAQTPPAFTPGGRNHRQLSSGRNAAMGEKGGSAPEQAAEILRREHPPGSKDAPPPPLQMQTREAMAAIPVQQPQPAAAAVPIKRRKWYLGIQSKKDPAHVMTEVYRALLQLGCEWRMLSSYRIQCLWRPDSDPAGSRGVLKRGDFKIPGEAGGTGVQGKGGAKGRDEGYRVIAGLTLYRVQVNIYLLDFHKREGDQFTFMTLCAKIIIQLKTLSAQSKMQIGRLPQSMPVDQRGVVQAPGQAMSIQQQQQMHAQAVAATGGVGNVYVHPQQQHQPPHPNQHHSHHQQQPQLSPTGGAGYGHHQGQQVSPQHYLPQPPVSQQRGPGGGGAQSPLVAPAHQHIQHGYVAAPGRGGGQQRSPRQRYD